MTATEPTVDGLPLIEGPKGGAHHPVPAFRETPSPFETIMIAAKDGDCPACLFRPAGEGPWPAVLFLMDGFGMRPTLHAMAQRVADAGYLVLLPDLFYRRGPYAPLDVPRIFAGGNLRQDVFDVLGASPSVPMIVEDAVFFLDYLAQHADAVKAPVGVTGYCMSGGMSLAIAGTYPDRVAAAACFHGGYLVNDSEASPHRFAATTRAEVYVGGAFTDEWCPPAMVAHLDQALSAAGVRHRCEVYNHTLHGWTMRDSPLYNEAAAERHWEELLSLLARVLH